MWRQVADIVSIPTAAQPLLEQYLATPVSWVYIQNVLVSLGDRDHALKIELLGLDKARAAMMIAYGSSSSNR
ncbi:hypothetical protein CQ14_37635 [Bradyrhizobium lablabi]|uniref:Uncharacterized protein n=1 Tax=Bradyrhizobium lablabi TaxID=722472 RepID=A0A0R3MC59_9BRAD|nr:hypothetical protein CQ14_37635 [Bradyrhizobium lablabi]